MKKWWQLAIALVLAAVLAYVVPSQNKARADIEVVDEKSYISQRVIGMYEEPVEVRKVYYKGILIGVLQNRTSLEATREKAYNAFYRANFPNSTIKFAEDVYFYDEKTYLQYEDKDQEISDYFYDNDLFLVEAYLINLGKEHEIYVRDADEFKEILRSYVMSYTTADVYMKMENNEIIPDLTQVDTQQDVKIYLEDTIKATKTGASASQILKTRDEIMHYLCYGENEDLEYYTVQEFDTVESIAKTYDMTEDQLIIINDSISSENQTLQAGMQVNVTLFTSPISVIVEKQRYIKETIVQEPAQYIQDETMEAGTSFVVEEGKDGLRHTLYQDVYVNGELTSYKQVTTTVVEEPVQRIVRVGTNTETMEIGDLNFTLPVTNPKIICGYSCYRGHTGTDFVDRYNRWGIVHACEDGIIIASNYNEAAGWQYRINHGNGYILRYGHMRTRGWYPAGTRVTRFQAIGDIGMTGAATTPHVHISVYYNGHQINPCDVLPCDQAR